MRHGDGEVGAERRRARRKRETHIVLFKWMGNDSLGFADNYTVGFNQFGPFTAWRGLIPSTKEQTVGGRYLRKRRPGVSNMRQHSPPNALHLSIWPLSELISWRIKTNRGDPMASGCLRRTLPGLSSPRGMRLTDKGHCVGHLHCHTPHLPCHVVRFDEVICWGRTRFDHQNLTAEK